ncbi:hypothetical protein [Cypionkella sp. TWP1-2-1b2]|uniref:hypothetical protein n=1 Tax=Cypionkella sp. TWP1-2-1b2 TaxID=2804675 RepID=UPI003CFAFAD9
MDNWLLRSALDSRFVDFAIFVSIAVWIWIAPVTMFIALFAWRFVLLCQVVALPFSVLGWAVGFRLGRSYRLRPAQAAMVAGWTGLLVAEIGMALVLLPFLGKAAAFAGLWAFPGLAAAVTIGVPWFYRATTWRRWESWNEGIAA